MNWTFLVDQQQTCNTGGTGSIPRLGRSPGEGNGNPHQYSCLENPMEPGELQIHGVVKETGYNN